MARTYDVMAAGHLCLDITPVFPDTGATRFADLLRPGAMAQAGPATIGTGGAVSNTGITLKNLGNRVCFCARIGDDAFGKLILELLEKSGDPEGVRVVSGAASSYSIVIAPPNIDRMFIHNPGANDDFTAGDLDPDVLAKCKLFHFGYPPIMRKIFENDGAELERVFKMAKDAGVTTSCDMALPDPSSPAGKADWPKIFGRVLPHVDIFLPSVEETLYTLEPDEFIRLEKARGGGGLIDQFTPEDLARLADKLLGFGVKLCALKLGRRGWYFKTAAQKDPAMLGAAAPGDPGAWANRELWAPALEVENFAAATGAGDASIAGFLTALLQGLGPETALRYATICGWQNVQVMDATSGIRSWEETTALLNQGRPIIDPKINDEAWTFREEHQLWTGPADKTTES